MVQVILLYLFADSAIHAVSQRYEKRTGAMLMRRLTYGLLAILIGTALAKSLGVPVAGRNQRERRGERWNS